MTKRELVKMLANEIDFALEQNQFSQETLWETVEKWLKKNSKSFRKMSEDERSDEVFDLSLMVKASMNNSHLFL